VNRGLVIEQGTARLPEGSGLGTRLHDTLFTPGRDSHRISRIGRA
jgi:hypothetical protein